MEQELTTQFNTYYNSFRNLSEEDTKNFKIKKDHSFRVAGLAIMLADDLNMNDDEKRLAYFIGLFHDIGRFSQLSKFGTFHDAKSVDHAEYSVKVLDETGIIKLVGIENEKIIKTAILNHNKLKIEKRLSEKEFLHSKILRDADKLDILKVLTDYYTINNSSPNHTLTWELPVGQEVSKSVGKEILAGKLVSKKNVVSEIDVKVMQMSWVFDLNFKVSFEYLLQKRFIEKIYNSLPKNDLVIEIYKQVKIYAGNKTFS